MITLVDCVVKSSVIVAAAVLATGLMRTWSAAARHWVLSMAVVSAALVPVVGAVAPRWVAHVDVVSVLAGSPAATGSTDGVTAASGAGGDIERTTASSATPLRTATIGSLVVPAWLTGAALSLSVLLLGLARLIAVASRARMVTDERRTRMAEDVARASGLRRRVLLLQSDHPALLVTWGARRPKIILPSAASKWSEARIRIVLAHEFAHIRRGDWTVQMVAAVVRSIYWFNPLLWLACRRLGQESERACDDAVLNGGVAGLDYASHLLELARSFNDRRPWLAASAIARPSGLERRIAAMLNARTNRHPMTPLARVATVVALLVVVIGVAGFSVAGQGQFSTFSGSVVDPTNAILPNTVLVLTHAQSGAKHEVRSDASGRFEFVGLPAGDYSFEARRPGFATLNGTLTITGQDVHRDLRLQLGTVSESIVVSGDTAGGRTPADRRPQKRDASACVASAVGGELLPPRKLVDVKPAYPQTLRDAGVEGVVLVDARIAGDGSTRDVKVVGTAQPDLAASAVEAIRQWEFDGTLLNCVPIDVAMRVTVQFKRLQ